MRKWSRTIGLLFTAAMSVYADQAFLAKTAIAADSTTAAKGNENDVKVVDQTAADPFVNAPAASDPTTQPSEGQSVTTTDVSVSDTGTVEIHVNDANLVEVLRMLSLQSQRNIIASNQVNGRVTANLYGVTVREALDAILHANGYAYREKGNFIYVYTTKEIADIEKSERQLSTQVFRLFYTPAANVITMIKPVLSAEGQASSTTAAANGLSSGATDTGGDTHATEDMIVVTDYADNLEKVRKVISEIDKRPQQILVEATILSARLNEDNALGVDFNIVGGVDFTQFLHSNGQITGANLPSGQDATVSDTVHSVGTGNTFTSSIPNGFKVGVVSNNASVFVSALEAVTDTVVLANPKVLALNKQKGEVIVGRKDGYITTTVTENAQTQTVEFLDTGTRLIFRPYIGDDGYIRMEIHPEDSSGGVTISGQLSLPHKTTTEVTSNILVKDNHTIMIGGLFRESSVSDRNQVPGIGNIPLAGALFRQQRDTTVREEVIILLTPHIIKDDDAYAQASRDMVGDIEKLRVGVRKGMMWWGRERMAECTYQTAVAELEKPNPDMSKVMWHLDCATNLNPKYLEAINLKKQLTGKRVWSSDNSIVRSFVTNQIMAEKENGMMYQTPPRAVPITPTTKPVGVGPAAPATQPSSVATTAAPSTQPVAEADDSESPSTQPAVAENDSEQPSTQPAVAEDTSNESSPATQPSEATAQTGDENASDSSMTDTSSEMAEPADDLNK